MLSQKPKLSFISLTSIIDPQEIEHTFYYSFAALIYQEKMLKAFSFEKVLAFNIHTRKHSSCKTEGNITYYQYPVAKWRRLIDIFRFAFSVSKKLSQNEAVLLYNVYLRSLPVFLLLKYIRRLKVYVLLADYEDPKKSLVNKFLSAVIRLSDGILSLSPNSRIHTNTIVQELLIDETQTMQAQQTGSPYHLLFSGTIATDTGIVVALQAMHFLPEYTLHISGQLSELPETEFEKLLSETPGNVVYHGKLSVDQYKQLLHRCGICLSLRNPDDGDQLYNFPSKIGEFLMHRKTVVSSMRYASFEPFLTYTRWTGQEVAQAIRQAKPAKDATQWLHQHFSLQTFRENLFRLISPLHDRSPKNRNR